jgi:hypothetical protein
MTSLALPEWLAIPLAPSSSLEIWTLNTSNFHDETLAFAHHSPYTFIETTDEQFTANMTRAQQTISIAMLLTSVRRAPPKHIPPWTLV